MCSFCVSSWEYATGLFRDVVDLLRVYLLQETQKRTGLSSQLGENPIAPKSDRVQQITINTCIFTGGPAMCTAWLFIICMYLRSTDILNI
jgi:hypothetical protein